MSAHVLGIDPGHEGAAVLLSADGRVSMQAIAWKRRERRKETVYELFSNGTPNREMPSLYAIGSYLAILTRETLPGYPQSGCHVAVEGLFARPGLELHGVVSLAEATGELLGPLRQIALSVERPRASEWRPAVLGLLANGASIDAELAAWRSLALARPPLVDGLDVWLGRTTITHKGVKREHPAWPHVCEAACIARWGWSKGRLERRFSEGS